MDIDESRKISDEELEAVTGGTWQKPSRGNPYVVRMRFYNSITQDVVMFQLVFRTRDEAIARRDWLIEAYRYNGYTYEWSLMYNAYA